MGELSQNCSPGGRPIPENDIWIAASAMEHGLILATRDGHFNEVNDLIVEIW
jgi:tRNA(fMet)-specific endonuclease VapC